MQKEKIRYGVIGIKGVGERHCLYARQNTRAELAAVVDIDSDFVAKKSAELGIPGFTDYRDLLERGIVDAVSIATPHDHHFDIAQDCLDAGVHVHIEKPIAPRLTEASKLTALAKAKNLKISVGHQYRLFRLSQIIKRVVDAQTLGEIRRLLWTWGVFRPHNYYDRWPWKGRFEQVGSGLLAYQNIHDLDLICWIFGQPIQVSAFIGNQYHQPETEDFACASILFANGAFGSLQFTINQPSSYILRQIAGDRGILMVPDVKSLIYDETDEVLLGSYEDDLPKMMSQLAGVFDQPGISWHRLEMSPEGSVSKRPVIAAGTDNDRLLKKKMSANNVWRRLGWARTHANTDSTEHRVDPMCTLIDRFIGAILDDSEPVVSGESALPAVELMNALMLSAIRKKTIDLPVDPNECDQAFDDLSAGRAQVARFR